MRRPLAGPAAAVQRWLEPYPIFGISGASRFARSREGQTPHMWWLLVGAGLWWLVVPLPLAVLVGRAFAAAGEEEPAEMQLTEIG